VELTTRIDRQPSLGRSVAADGIEGFERQRERIHERVARSAHGFGAVLLESLALRLRLVRRGLVQGYVYIAGRWADGLAQERFRHELTVQRRGALLLVRELREETGFAENAQTRAIRRQREDLESVRGEVGGVQPVELCEVRVRHDLRGREQLERARLVVE